MHISDRLSSAPRSAARKRRNEPPSDPSTAQETRQARTDWDGERRPAPRLIDPYRDPERDAADVVLSEEDDPAHRLCVWIDTMDVAAYDVAGASAEAGVSLWRPDLGAKSVFELLDMAAPS